MAYASDKEAIDALSKKYSELQAELGKKVIGQEEIIKYLLISIFSNGHCLLVGVPGLAKTLLVNSIAEVLDLSFNRIQFTPDLLPSDITGSEILGDDRKFQFTKGPIFANIILADEINRTPPKTQAALLEAMQERSVTVSGHSYQLTPPFFVLATQNPIEQEGTYPLPEAQLDRFMFNIWIDYPSYQNELAIVKATTTDNSVKLNQIIGGDDIVEFQHLIRKMPVTDNVIEYAVSLVQKTRLKSEHTADITNTYLLWGAGPRASQNLILAAKCHAAISGKYSPDIEDVKAVALPILRHRIVRNYKAEAEGMTNDKIIQELL